MAISMQTSYAVIPDSDDEGNNAANLGFSDDDDDFGAPVVGTSMMSANAPGSDPHSSHLGSSSISEDPSYHGLNLPSIPPPFLLPSAIQDVSTASDFTTIKTANTKTVHRSSSASGPSVDSLSSIQLTGVPPAKKPRPRPRPIPPKPVTITSNSVSVPPSKSPRTVPKPSSTSIRKDTLIIPESPPAPPRSHISKPETAPRVPFFSTQSDEEVEPRRPSAGVSKSTSKTAIVAKIDRRPQTADESIVLLLPSDFSPTNNASATKKVRQKPQPKPTNLAKREEEVSDRAPNPKKRKIVYSDEESEDEIAIIERPPPRGKPSNRVRSPPSPQSLVQVLSGEHEELTPLKSRSKPKKDTTAKPASVAASKPKPKRTSDDLEDDYVPDGHVSSKPSKPTKPADSPKVSMKPKKRKSDQMEEDYDPDAEKPEKKKSKITTGRSVVEVVVPPLVGAEKVKGKKSAKGKEKDVDEKKAPVEDSRSKEDPPAKKGKSKATSKPKKGAEEKDSKRQFKSAEFILDDSDNGEEANQPRREPSEQPAPRSKKAAKEAVKDKKQFKSTELIADDDDEALEDQDVPPPIAAKAPSPQNNSASRPITKKKPIPIDADEDDDDKLPPPKPSSRPVVPVIPDKKPSSDDKPAAAVKSKQPTSEKVKENVPPEPIPRKSSAPAVPSAKPKVESVSFGTPTLAHSIPNRSLSLPKRRISFGLSKRVGNRIAPLHPNRKTPPPAPPPIVSKSKKKVVQEVEDEVEIDEKVVPGDEDRDYEDVPQVEVYED